MALFRILIFWETITVITRKVSVYGRKLAIQTQTSSKGNQLFLIIISMTCHFRVDKLSVLICFFCEATDTQCHFFLAGECKTSLLKVFIGSHEICVPFFNGVEDKPSSFYNWLFLISKNTVLKIVFQTCMRIRYFRPNTDLDGIWNSSYWEWKYGLKREVNGPRSD